MILASRNGGRGIGIAHSSWRAMPKDRTTPIYPLTWQPATPVWAADADIARVDEPVIASGVLGNNIACSVALPINYDSSGLDYPVVWMFHGASAGGDNNRQIAATWPGRYGQAVRSLLVRPHITVFVNGVGESFYVNNRRGTMNWESFFWSELYPYIRSTYRVLPGKTKQLVAGFSMGAVGAFYYAFKYPNIFGGIHAYGPPMYDPMTSDFANTAAVNSWAPDLISSDVRSVAETERIYSGVDRAAFLTKHPYGYVNTVPDSTPIRIVYGGSDPLRVTLGANWKTAMTAAGLSFPVVADLAGVAHNPTQYYSNADTDNMFAFFESVFVT